MYTLKGNRCLDNFYERKNIFSIQQIRLVSIDCFIFLSTINDFWDGTMPLIKFFGNHCEFIETDEKITVTTINRDRERITYTLIGPKIFDGDYLFESYNIGIVGKFTLTGKFINGTPIYPWKLSFGPHLIADINKLRNFDDWAKEHFNEMCTEYKFILNKNEIRNHFNYKKIKKSLKKKRYSIW